jgi:hypothetical protein
VVGGDEVGVDGEPEDPETLVEVVLPDGGVPLGRAALELLATPDVVDEDVDVAVRLPEVAGNAAAMPRPAPRVAPATTATRPRSAPRSGEGSIAQVCQPAGALSQP